MDLINQFIDNYKKKFNYYESVGRLAAGQLEAVLRSSGIRAMVTYRAKNPGRLKSKGTPPQCQAPGSLPEYKGNL